MPVAQQVQPVVDLFPTLMEDGLLRNLGLAAKEAREQADLKIIRIAYTGNRSEAAVSRFERGEVWPEHIETLIAAYAEEANVRPIEIWTAALERWQAEIDDAPSRAAEAAEAAAGENRKQRDESAQRRDAKKRRRGGGGGAR